jgi:ribonuclease-3
MNLIEQLTSQVSLIEQKLRYAFLNPQLLALAFVHRSFFNENRQWVAESNERLEFLGDSVLGLIASDYLYAHLPQEAEGQLSHLRAQLVEAGHCAHLLLQLNVAQYLLLGKGERFNEGRGRDTILADLFEAIVGAIYLDGGLEAAKQFFFDHYSLHIVEYLAKPLRNWKAELQDLSQKRHQKPPLYRIVKESGPDHSKVFHVAVKVDEEEVGMGMGSSKKEAEQAAAQEALERLGGGCGQDKGSVELHRVWTQSTEVDRQL